MNLSVNFKKLSTLRVLSIAIATGGCVAGTGATPDDNGNGDNGQGGDDPVCIGAPSITCDAADAITCEIIVGCQAKTHDVCSDLGDVFGGAGCGLYVREALCGSGCSWQNNRCVQSVDCGSIDAQSCKRYDQCTIMHQHDQCVGQVTPCEQLSRAQCTDTPGCRLAAPECQGTVTDKCGAHSGSTVTACNAVKGCHATLKAGDLTCDGTVRQCYQLSASDCPKTRGCTLTDAGRVYSSSSGSTSSNSSAGSSGSTGSSSSGSTASKEQARVDCMDKCWKAYSNCSDACTYYGNSWADPDTYSDCSDDCSSSRSSCENRC